MNVRVTLGLAGMAVLIAVSPAYGQEKPEDLLQSGRYAEEVEGDLRAALRIFQSIVKDFPGHRAVVATALVRIGRAFETLGEAGARQAYQRVLDDYPGQAGAAAEARARLASLQPESDTDPTFALVLDLEASKFTDIDLSPDGNRVLAVGPRTSGPAGMFISDGGGVGPRPFLQDRSGERVHFARWSPDGTQIAYKAILRDAESGTMAVRIYVVSADGGEPRQIGRDQQTSWGYSSSAWTPAGDVTTFRRDGDDLRGVFETLDTDGNTIREVNPLSDASADLEAVVGPLSYSPDGRWLAFYAIEGTGGAARNAVWAIPTPGGRARRLATTTTQDAGRAGFAWGNDGRSFFVTGLGGDADKLQKLTFDPSSGEVSGEPDLIASFDGGLITALRPLTDGGLAYVLYTRTNYVVTGNASRPDETRTFARGTAGQVSPDGRTVYFVGEGYGREGIFEAPIAGGAARRITSTVPAPAGFLLSPDASAISYQVYQDDETSLFVLPVQGGEPRLIARLDGRDAVAPEWSPDGSRLAFAHGGDLFTVSAEGGEPERIAQLREWETWSIRWSPDGAHVAGFGYAEGEFEPNNAIFVVPANGGELHRLTPFEEDGDVYPYKEGLEWHPDGRRLSYSAYGPESTHMAYLDGSPTTVLLDGNAWDYVGKWTPDGGTYLFLKQGELSGVYAYDVARGTREYYSAWSTMQRGGLHWSWSRDGSTFVATHRKTTLEVWLISDSN